MEGIRTMIRPQDRVSIWKRVKTLFYHIDARPMPLRVYLGPLLILLSSAITCYRIPEHSIYLIFGALFSIYPVMRWTLKGAGASTLFLFILYLIVGRSDPLFNFLFLASSIVSFFTSAIALDDWTSEEESKVKEYKALSEELALWKRRFETLSEKHLAEKSEFEETHELNLSELAEAKEYTNSLKELVELANSETKRYFDLSRQLMQEKEPPQEQMELFSEEPRMCKMDDEYIKTVEHMAEFALSSYVKYKSTKS